MRSKKAVKFATVESPQSPSYSSTAPILDSDAGTNPIFDLCAKLNQVCIIPNVIGYLIDESVQQYRHDVYLVNENLYTSTGSKSLNSLLEISSKRALGYYLSRKDRLHIAVVLASSVLQLDGTPWLKEQWRSDDIFFLQREDPNSNVQKLDYANPYVSAKISPDCSEPSSVTNVRSAVTAHLIRSEVLFALGLTLTELCFGQTLADLQIPEDVNTTVAFTNYQTAGRLLDYVYNESGNRYDDVVRRCLQCPFDVRDASLDNEDFQQAVFESIVTPLTQDLEDFNGGSRIR